jgi:hypothetical protein
MQIALPQRVHDQFSANPAALSALLAFLSLLLRLWTIAGELLLAAFAAASDYKGMLNLPGGRHSLIHVASNVDLLEESTAPQNSSSDQDQASASPAPSSDTIRRETPPKPQAQSSAR